MGCCTEQSVWQPLINLGRVGRGVENVQFSDEQDDFQVKKETKMLTSLSNVERKHFRFFFCHENHCAADHKHFHAPVHAPEIY